VNRLPDPAPHDPCALIERWLADAVRGAGQRNPTAMSLATSTSTGRVSARMVLLKSVSAEGYGVFFTHYESRKAQELAANPRAAAVLHWDLLGRQLRFEGPIVRAPAADSDLYFATRPWRSQLNAWASQQSQPIDSPEALDRRAQSHARALGLPDPLNADAPQDVATIVARPACWGGFRLWFESVEIWLEGQNRFHDRIRYERCLDAQDSHTFATGPWTHQRLQP
jgi:pyridoxamine 5'-phosphate oxidase